MKFILSIQVEVEAESTKAAIAIGRNLNIQRPVTVISARECVTRLGDTAERLFKPIAKALKLPCLDKDDNLKPESGCAKRRDALNRLTT